MLLSSVQELEDFVSTTSRKLWIEEALVVTPAALNSTGCWLMEPLLEVSEIVDRHGAMAGHSFRVKNGKSYFTVSSERPELCSPKSTVFDAAVHLQRASQ